MGTKAKSTASKPVEVSAAEQCEKNISKMKKKIEKKLNMN